MARLVGTEGTLGVQADVKDVSGVWKELTDNVNLMGRNLTDQVRDIATVGNAMRYRRSLEEDAVEVKESCSSSRTPSTLVDSLVRSRRRRAWRAKWGRMACSAGRRSCATSPASGPSSRRT
jgi:hypothetical protein